ncbi:hypothetical protein [uncultured Aquimarina sp.]|uniref:hypothetical protein n=1 Tax=uncultured Aquimarina sp. TaxID=575652 RepID=UPI00262ED17F|nr:hypothetical protein [uncultured Aquimarina sp.]
MQKYKFVIIIIVVCSLSISCNNCDQVQGIEISELLNRQIDDSYCEILDNAINLDKKSIVKISRYKISDAAGYDHGYVLVRLIEKIGEEEYFNGFQNLSLNEKKSVLSYLKAGLENGGNKIYKFKKLDEIFPILSKSLK